jgi:hypothetical protein
VPRTTAHYASTWARESSWSGIVETTDHFAAAWRQERSWSVVEHTTDNVTTFTCGTIVAAGSTQGTATAIATDTVGVTSTGVNQGVILPAGCYRVTVRNNNAGGGNNINVYPPTGAKLAAILANMPFSLAAQGAYLFIEVSTTQWDYVQLT